MEPFLGQIQPFGFNFNPVGWAKCDGQLLAISSNQALFALLGTFYGGDGRTTFGLPELRGRTMIHQGQGPGLSHRSIGQRSGVETTTINVLNLPRHNHNIIQGNGGVNVTLHTVDNGNDSNESDNGANALGTSGNSPDIYRSDPGVMVDKVAGVNISGETTYQGGQQPFNNMQPYLVINVCIALQGLFPSRS